MTLVIFQTCQYEKKIAKKAKEIPGGNAVFGGSVGSAAVSSQFHIALPNFRAVTLLWAEIIRVSLLISKSGTSASPLYTIFYLKAIIWFTKYRVIVVLVLLNLVDELYKIHNNVLKNKVIYNLRIVIKGLFIKKLAPVSSLGYKNLSSLYNTSGYAPRGL